MLRPIFTIALLIAFQWLSAQPKLVVGLVVDQMRWDYLQRYSSQFSKNGFGRLLMEGAVFTDCKIPYIPTYTAPGHASIYSGSVPALHGIAGNDWISRSDLKSHYCVEDPAVRPLGGTDKAGKMSPKNLLASSLGDEIKLSGNFKGKVIGIAIKDRSAILPAGHGADAAYWYDPDSMNWISSSWYMNALPQWVMDFNRSKKNLLLMKEGWKAEAEVSFTQSTADDSPYEKNFRNESSPVFPHLQKLSDAEKAAQIRVSPQGSTFTLDFAREALLREGLGKDSHTDLLAISFSSPDYVGHQFGTFSMETEHVYRQLDRDLAAFLGFLDQEVGKGNYLLFLTADHGAAHNARFLQDSSMHAGLFKEKAMEELINRLLQQRYGEGPWVKGFNNQQIYLNDSLVHRFNPDLLEMASWLGEKLEMEGVQKVIALDYARSSSVTKSVLERVVNGYYPARCGHLQVLFSAGYMSDHYEKGTTHGTHYNYDTHIPLIFMGAGVKAGLNDLPCEMTDIAPSVCQWLGIQEPNAAIGKSLLNVGEIDRVGREQRDQVKSKLKR